MKRAATSKPGYRRRLILLVAGVLVLGAILVKKRVGPTLALWRQCRQLEADQRAGVDLEGEQRQLTAQLASIMARSGGTGPAQDRWRAVLSRIGSTAGTEAPRLIALAPEHLQTIGGRTIHTLPVTLEGRTEALLRLSDELERRTDGVHLVSLDLHTTRPLAGGQRKLQATLYLRTLAP